jgi:hypothetical protein
LQFSPRSEWGGFEAKSQLLLLLLLLFRHGKSMVGHIVSLRNLTEIEEGHDKEDGSDK